MDESDEEISIDIKRFSEKTPLLPGFDDDFQSTINWESISYYPFERLLILGNKTITFKNGEFLIQDRFVKHPKVLGFSLKLKGTKDEGEAKKKDKPIGTCAIILIFLLLFVPIINIFVFIRIIIYLTNHFSVSKKYNYAIMTHSKNLTSYYRGLYFTERPKRKFEVLKEILKRDRVGVFDYRTIFEVLRLNCNIIEIHWKNSGKNVEEFYVNIKPIVRANNFND